jgi:hypothetical protein
LKFILVISALLIGGILGLKTALHDGYVRNYLDTHPDPKVVPPVAFYLAEGYYIFRDLENSATYYQRVSDRYPQSPYADDAYYNYLVALDEMNTPRPQMAELYQTYAERFPQGKNLEIVLKRLENTRNGR